MLRTRELHVRRKKMKHLIIIISLFLSAFLYGQDSSDKSKQPTTEEISQKTKSWLKSKSFEDFNWFKDNVLKVGVHKDLIIKYLGEPLSTEDTKEYTLLWYKKINVEKKEYYACYLAIDLNKKLLWVTSKGVE